MQRTPQWVGRNVLIYACIWAALATCAATGWGEPYFAVREGYKCSQCHTNITGGGKRNSFGLIYSQTTLPHTIVSVSSMQKLLGDAADSDYGTFVSAALADFVSVGGNLRVENRTVFEEGPLETRNDFSVTEANVYLEANLLADFLTLYVDERLGPGGAGNREIFGLLRLPRFWNFYCQGRQIPIALWLAVARR